jgi:DNA-directed RNA polymerase subunit beta
MEGDTGSYNREEESFGAMGYQKQEFDEDGELVSAEDEDEDDEAFEDDFDAEYADSLDE